MRDVLQLQWGWITPGTGESNRHEQSDRHLRFLAASVMPRTRHFLLVHCGWWLDTGIEREVRGLTERNPEPNRALTPCSLEVAALRRYVRTGRLEYVAYPYAACVAEATSGEGLLRSLRFSQRIAVEVLGQAPRAVLNHDSCYGLDWCAAQMPQIARLLGIQYILAMDDGIVRAPDGTEARILGRAAPRQRLELIAPGPQAVYFPLELTQSMTFHRNLPMRPPAERKRLDLRAITLDEYLRCAPAGQVFDSRRLGSKSWYGGVTDALVMEQNVKSVELRLPAIEALASLSRIGDPGLTARLEVLWKKAFILMDNHTLWQCHDYRAHYLPRSFDLAREAKALEARVLKPKRRASTVMLFNPTPWPRDLVVCDGRRILMARGVRGWSACAIARRGASTSADGDPFALSNDLVSYKLNAKGQVSEIERDGRRQDYAGLGRLLRIHETPLNTERVLRAGEKLTGFEGALSATFEIELGGIPRDSVTFHMPEITGEAYLMQSERLGAIGQALGVEWVPLHSLHWAGKGMPRRRGEIAPQVLLARDAVRLRVTLWMISEGTVRLGRAIAPPGGPVSAYHLRLLYRNTYSEPEGVRARVVRNGAGIKSVRFSGRVADAKFDMDLSLRAGSGTLEHVLRVDFATATALGLTTPPFTRDDGSLLGAQCERPYVPGLAVLFPLAGRAQYYVDKPYFIQRALVRAERTWSTDRRDWWLGMSPFIGMNMAVAEHEAGQLGLVTRGLKHFFRWRREGSESLGLSLGASLIHPQTQGHSVPDDSLLYPIAKRLDHDPYPATRFLWARGRYEFAFGICPGSGGEGGRRDIWRAAQEFALPAHAVLTSCPAGAVLGGVRTEPAAVVITAIEMRGDAMAVRWVNMSGRSRAAMLHLPFRVDLAAPSSAGETVSPCGTKVRATLRPWAVREMLLRPVSPRGTLPRGENAPGMRH